ncbi:MAG: LytTR family transcriptional regulator DNA-binding domain-containing protein [Gemmatimonadota bacterium]|jgi:two-component system LytT family response regulator
MTDANRVGRCRALIVDDEPHARAVIRGLLELDDEIEVVGECFGERTPAQIRELVPDLVFLDVQMPRMDGIEVLSQLDPDALPLVIFTTAYDEFALQAFEHAAVDYLLKPFSDRRFFQAVARAKGMLRARDLETAQRRLLALLADRLNRDESEAPVPGPALARTPTDERVMLRDGGRILLFDAADVVWIEARGAYVHVHTTGGRFLVRESIGELEARLDSRSFFRIHRSAIVNMRRVLELRPLSHGDCAVVLRGGTELKLSRLRREEFEMRLAGGNRDSS